MERRDRAEAERKQKASDRDSRAFSRRMEHAEEVDRVWLQAEDATKGNMVNAKGRAARHQRPSPHDGARAGRAPVRFEELLNFFAENPRPTVAHLRGKDTRLGAIYTPPKRRRGYRAAYQRASLRKAA